ncbi:chitobiase [Bacteroidia bacterium]|nr:chitobiase [Bacteroidia bacterium]
MKKIFNKTVILAVAFLLLASCDGMMDVHKEYIEGGELIYAPKIDSLNFIAGKERILFEFRLYNSPNVKTVDVYWNSKQDSMIIPVSPTSGLDSFYVILPNMAEQSYTFDVRTTDNFGHKSLWTTDFGNSYGERYISTVSNRRIRSINLTDRAGEINWMSGGEGMVRVEVEYRAKNGEIRTVHTSANDSKTLCLDVASNSKFRYRSLFIPESLSIDTLALSWEEYETAFPGEYMFDRSDWSVVSVSDETASDGGGKNTLIDGDLGTFWHSQWDGGNAPLPHWAIIDMISPKNFFRIDIYRRAGNTDSKSVEIYIGNSADPDDASWTKIAEGQFNSGDKLTIDIPSGINTATGRYLKVFLPDSNRDPFISIAEIYFWGK